MGFAKCKILGYKNFLTGKSRHTVRLHGIKLSDYILVLQQFKLLACRLTLDRASGFQFHYVANYS